MASTTRFFAALAVAVVALLGYQTCALKGARADASRQAQRADSLEAANDTTKELVGKAARVVQDLYGDSLRAYERRVIQTEQQRDALDRTLNRTTTVNAALTARIDSLRVTTTATTSHTDTATGTRTDSFRIRQAPFTVGASVTIPRSGASTLGVAVALDSVPLRVRLQCGRDGDFKTAHVVLVTPPWMRAGIDSVQQSPDICNPPPRRRWYDGRFTVGPSANINVTRNGEVTWGLGVSGQLSIWRWP